MNALSQRFFRWFEFRSPFSASFRRKPVPLIEPCTPQTLVLPLAFLILNLTAVHSFAAAPANDPFVNSRLITGAAGAITGTTAGASLEPGEPVHAAEATGRSVWYAWHCSSGGTLDLSLSSPQTGYVLAVYTGGSLETLTPVASAQNQSVRLQLVPGMVYRIAIDGLGGDSGVHTLNWKQTFLGGGGPDLTIPEGIIQLKVVDQTFPLSDCEVSERCVVGGKRRLLRFDMHTLNTGSEDIVFGSPADSPLFQYAPCHNHYHFEALATYRVLTISNDLVRVGNKFGFCLEDVFRVSPVSSGTKRFNCDFQGLQAGWSDIYNADLPCQYVDLTGLPPGEYQLEIEVDPLHQIPESDESNNLIRLPFELNAPCSGRPANDDFLNAQVIQGMLVTVRGDTTCATRQSGEPSHAPLNASPPARSVWYSWTAPESGTVIVSTEGSAFDTVLAVYAGPSLTPSGNSRIAFDDDISEYNRQSRLSFEAVAGTKYLIAVDGAEQSEGAQGGQVVLNINPSGNDAFDTRAPLTGAGGSVLGYIHNATREAGEPLHAGQQGDTSVWYEWTAPSTGPFVFHTIGSDFDSLLAVYTGDALESLTPRVSDDDSGGHGNSRVLFDAVAGQAYQIAVDRKRGTLSPASSGVLKLGWNSGTVSQSPTIVSQPNSVTTFVGSNAVFSVSALGTLPLSYQWFHGDAPLAEGVRVLGAQGPNLSLLQLLDDDRGIYKVEVSNAQGSLFSTPVNLVAATPNRVLHLEPMVVNPGGTFPTTVGIAAQGGEHFVQFSLSYDPAKLLNPSVELAPGLPAGAILEKDLTQTLIGWLGVRVTLPPGEVLQAGEQSLVTAMFRVSNDVLPEERIRICFEDQPVSRTVKAIDLTSLKTSYACGSLIVQFVDTLSVRLQNNGSVELTLNGSPGTHYEFQQSSDLLNWVGFTVEENVQGTVTVLDSSTSGVQQRFYRTVRLP